MRKDTKFSGNPILGQVLNFLNWDKIRRTAYKNQSDKYYKVFTTENHLRTMITSIVSSCSSLRELETILLACDGKINHLGLTTFPRRSTISDANINRPSSIFGEIYDDVYKQYRKILADSSVIKPAIENLKILDATTISLFSEILRGAGRNCINGKKKGGIKMHTMINALEDVPCLIRFTEAATHDHILLKDLELKKGSFVVFDRGYNDYLQYLQWSLDGVYFVTRQKQNAVYKSVEEFDIPDNIDSAILKDEKIELEKDGKTITLRRIAFWDDGKKKVYEFITNNFELSAETIASIYKNRWQIEVLFKRLKQNFPLKYFLGDSQNAIEIQIWISLIIHLLLLVIHRQTKRKWAYSNMVSLIRYHLLSYIDLFRFLNNPKADFKFLTNLPLDQLNLDFG